MGSIVACFILTILLDKDMEQSEKSTPLLPYHGGEYWALMGLCGTKWEVGSGKKRIIGPFLVQSTLTGSFGQILRFGP